MSGDHNMSQKPNCYDPIELHVLHSHFAWLLFDFIGWLTSRKERLTLSSSHETGPAVEAVIEFAAMRGLMLEDAHVQHLQAILTRPQLKNDFNPDWDTIKPFYDQHASDTDLFKQCLDVLEYEADRGNDDAYRDLRDALKERLK